MRCYDKLDICQVLDRKLRQLNTSTLHLAILLKFLKDVLEGDSPIFLCNDRSFIVEVLSELNLCA